MSWCCLRSISDLDSFGRCLPSCFRALQFLGSTVDTVHTSVSLAFWYFTQFSIWWPWTLRSILDSIPRAPRSRLPVSRKMLVFSAYFLACGCTLMRRSTVSSQNFTLLLRHEGLLDVSPGHQFDVPFVSGSHLFGTGIFRLFSCSFSAMPCSTVGTCSVSAWERETRILKMTLSYSPAFGIQKCAQQMLQSPLEMNSRGNLNIFSLNTIAGSLLSAVRVFQQNSFREPSMDRSCELSRAWECRGRREFYSQVTWHLNSLHARAALSTQTSSLHRVRTTTTITRERTDKVFDNTSVSTPFFVSSGFHGVPWRTRRWCREEAAGARYKRNQKPATRTVKETGVAALDIPIPRTRAGGGLHYFPSLHDSLAVGGADHRALRSFHPRQSSTAFRGAERDDDVSFLPGQSSTAFGGAHQPVHGLVPGQVSTASRGADRFASVIWSSSGRPGVCLWR